ncbi:ester cyclase [Arthrobacter pascens]|uniref:ester cyclase n=1 Tax=Arthrobacter pascens TaxID=1677 RepID=UPI00358FC37B
MTASGTHEGELPGPLPPSGAPLRESAVAVHRIQDGRIVEHWSNRDDLGLMQQLGVIHLPGQ